MNQVWAMSYDSQEEEEEVSNFPFLKFILNIMYVDYYIIFIEYDSTKQNVQGGTYKHVL